MKIFNTGKKNVSRSGFSLVELVVVVLVLGIIAAIAAPKMFDTAGDARNNSTLQSLAVVRDSIELHRAQIGTYPGDAGTEADFKSDLAQFIKGRFPRNQITGAANDGTVSVVALGLPLTALGAEDWKYDNTTGDLIINTAGFDTF